MRTKALLGLAALAVGLSTSVAQNVYSLNVVGYLNVTVKGNGYTLCANQLNNGTNGINQVLPNAPDDAQVLKFANNTYTPNVASGGVWYDAGTGNPSTVRLNPGEGWFYFNPGVAGTLTLVGEVPQGSGLTVNLPANYSLVGTYTPQALELSATNGFAVVDDMQYLSFANNTYVPAIAAGGAWFDAGTGNPATIIPAVGQGWFLYNPTPVHHDWVRNFTVQ